MKSAADQADTDMPWQGEAARVLMKRDTISELQG